MPSARLECTDGSRAVSRAIARHPGLVAVLCECSTRTSDARVLRQTREWTLSIKDMKRRGLLCMLARIDLRV